MCLNSFFSLESFVTMDRSWIGHEFTCKVSGCLATIDSAVILQHNGEVESVTVLLPPSPFTPKGWFLMRREGEIQCFTWEETGGLKPGTFSLQLLYSLGLKLPSTLNQAPMRLVRGRES